MHTIDWLYPAVVVIVIAGFVITSCLLAFWPRNAPPRGGDLLGFMNGIFSLPVFTWFFLVFSSSQTAKWIGGIVILATIVSLAFQFVRLWNSSRSPVA